MTSDYILDIARTSQRPVAVFYAPALKRHAYQWRVMPVEGRRYERVVSDLGLHRCMGVYTDDCPPAWINEDIEHMLGQEKAAA